MAALTFCFLYSSSSLAVTVYCSKVEPATVVVLRSSAGTLIRPAPGAKLWVCPAGSPGTPCNASVPIYSPLGIQITNPMTADTNGNFGQVCVATPNRYMLQVGGTGLTTNTADGIIFPNDPASPIFSGTVTAGNLIGGSSTSPNIFGPTTINSFNAGFALTLSGTNSLSASGAITSPQINNRFFVDGVKYPFTQSGVQAALTATCAFAGQGLGGGNGGDFTLQPGVLALATNTGQLLLSTCPLGLHGSTGEATLFQAAGGISSAIPVARFQVSQNVAQIGLHIDHIVGQSATGTATAGDFILLDTGSSGGGFPGPIMTEIDHVVTDQGAFNGFDINTTGQSVAPNIYGLWAHDNLLQNGVKVGIQLADISKFDHNNLHTRAGSGNFCFDITQAPGGSHLTLIHNAADQCDAGVAVFHQAIGPKTLFNQFEASLTCTGTNSAMLDYRADVGAIEGAEVAGNNLNAHATCGKNINLGAATSFSHIHGNRIIPNPTGGVGINCVAGTTNNTFGPNDFSLSGTATAFNGCNTEAAKTRVYANSAPGMPDTIARAPSDTDNALAVRANSATQVSDLAVFQVNGTTVTRVDKAGNIIVNNTGGTNSNSQLQLIGANSADISLENTSGGADSKFWDISAQPSSLLFRLINDANNSATTFLTINRSGMTATNFIHGSPFGVTESTAPSGVAGTDLCYGDSTSHTLKCSYNNGTFGNNVLSGIGNSAASDVSERRFKANQGTAYSGADAAIVLSAGWGTGPAVSAAAGFDQAFSFSATAGTTPGANPTITVTFKDGTWTAAPQCIVSRNDIITPFNTPPHTWTTSATQLVVTFNGTPTASNVYKYVVMCMGN
jgi:hypothetical protein